MAIPNDIERLPDKIKGRNLILRSETKTYNTIIKKEDAEPLRQLLTTKLGDRFLGTKGQRATQ